MATKKKNQKAETTTEQTTTNQASETKPIPAPEPAPQKPKKISGNEFVGRYLITHPEASEDEVKTALTEAGLKLNEYAVHAWVKDWKWMVPALEEAGWKRP